MPVFQLTVGDSSPGEPLNVLRRLSRPAGVARVVCEWGAGTLLGPAPHPHDPRTSIVTVVDALSTLALRGVAVAVATRDEYLAPTLARGWGPAVQDESFTLCVAAAEGSPTRRNIDANQVVSVIMSLPTTYESVQVKGAATLTREPTAEETARARRHFELFEQETAAVGVPPALIVRLFSPQLWLVEIRIESVFDQTPGPGAGGRR